MADGHLSAGDIKSMGDNVTVRPNDEDAHSHHHVMLHTRVLEGDGLVIGTQGRITVSWNGKSYVIDLARQPAAGISGFRWQNPKELDPTKSVAKDVFVYVSPLNPLVTDGIVDLVTDVLVFVKPGVWQARKAVPAKDGDGKYNAPQHPYPNYTGENVLDDDTIFWIYWGDIVC